MFTGFLFTLNISSKIYLNAKATVISHYCSEWHLHYRPASPICSQRTQHPFLCTFAERFPSPGSQGMLLPSCPYCKSYIPFRNSSNPVSSRKSSMPIVAHRDFSFAKAHMITCCLVGASPFPNFNIFAEWIKSNLWKSGILSSTFPYPTPWKQLKAHWVYGRNLIKYFLICHKSVCIGHM